MEEASGGEALTTVQLAAAVGCGLITARIWLAIIAVVDRLSTRVDEEAAV